jgi:hypothetical protein
VDEKSYAVKSRPPLFPAWYRIGHFPMDRWQGERRCLTKRTPIGGVDAKGRNRLDTERGNAVTDKASSPLMGYFSVDFQSVFRRQGVSRKRSENEVSRE